MPDEIGLDLAQAEEQSFELDEAQISMGEEEGLGISFYPPLYIQRYEKALEFLLEERWVHAISRVVIPFYFLPQHRRSRLTQNARSTHPPPTQ